MLAALTERFYLVKEAVLQDLKRATPGSREETDNKELLATLEEVEHGQKRLEEA